MFTPQHTLPGAQAFYSDVKGRMAKYCRAADQMRIMPGLNAIAGRTDAEAQDKYAALQALIHPDVGVELLSNAIGDFDLRPYDIDGPLPPEVFSHTSTAGVTSRKNVLAWARDEGLTIASCISVSPARAGSGPWWARPPRSPTRCRHGFSAAAAMAS